jgi:16S rRNA (uracil1498-N3)-methyltransferase
LFVPPGACDRDVFELRGADAERLFARGAREGDLLIALDNSGWSMTVELTSAARAEYRGQVVARTVADERRTKISLYQGLLHPSDFRRLLVRATETGVVEFVPVITDSSVVPVLGPDGRPEGESEWPRLVRDAAEQGGRGRLPVLRQPLLFDHALDEALRRGAVVLVDPSGAAIETLAEDRPFSIDVLCPPPSGFTPEELARARALEVGVVRAPYQGPDPIQPALTALSRMYDVLEDEPAP